MHASVNDEDTTDDASANTEKQHEDISINLSANTEKKD